MTLLTLSKVERSYGDLLVFADVSLRIDERDRIGIIGDNGTGKTTLVKVLIGEDPPDGGERTVRRDLEIAWTSQIPELATGMTVREAACGSFARLEEMESELRRLEEEMAADPENARLMLRHEHIHVAFEAAGGYRREQFAEQTLQGLGFSGSDLEKPVDVLSGGEKARVALTRAMLLPAELLVLDEPTNHLDLEGIAFLEDWLLDRSGAFVVVSHDRRFLDRVCTSLLELDSGKVTRYRGNFTAYKEQKERELKTALREFQKQEGFFAKEMAYIRKHMGSRWTAQAKGRLKRLQRVERLAKPKGEGRGMALRLGEAKGLAGQTVLEGIALGMAFGEQQLFENVDFRVFHGDRIGILGRNGTGKSTLLRIIAGDVAALAGAVERAKKLRMSYFSQEMEDLPRSGTVLESFMQLVPQWTEGECRDHLARFVFHGDDVDTDVALLSGGEKRRLCLARLVVSPADLYLMDEPTNHLDITTREALEEALRAYPGTVVLVSHDRYFLDEIVGRVFELRDRGLEVHEGGVARFEERLAERRSAAKVEKRAERTRPAATAPRKVSKDDGKIRNPYAFEKLEQRIFALEEELAALQEQVTASLTDAESWKNPEQLKSMQKRDHEIRAELASLYEQWENWQ